MGDPLAHWALEIHTKTERERQMIQKTYEKLFQDVAAVIAFAARHGSDRFCFVEIPCHPLVDRTVLRDYCIRRLCKLNFTVSVAANHPFHLCVNWIQSSPSPSSLAAAASSTSETAADGDDDAFPSQPPTAPQEKKSRKKKSKLSKSILAYLRAVANPSKIIGV